MISRLIYRCPLCAGYDWLRGARCIHCGATVGLERQSRLIVNGRSASIGRWYDRILKFELPADRRGLIYKSDRVRLLKEVPRGRYTGPGGLTAVLFGRKYVDTVTTALYQDRIELAGANSNLVIAFEALLSITIESNVIIVIDRSRGPLFLDFSQDSGKKWEDGIRRVLAAYRQPDRVAEFFPRIRLTGNLRERPVAVSDWRLPQIPIGKARQNGSHPVYSMVRRVVRAVIETGLQIEWSGREHLPRAGAAILLANHSSFLDAIILEAITPRNIWFMTKNSQYKGRFMTWFLGLAKSFPVRRYTVDVQAVRNAIRVVQGGHILGIFPEGERSWDNRMLPFKRGTMRLALALGVPVIPVGISGAYGLMPRWTHRVKRVPVRIRFGAPIHIEPVSIPAQTEADIAAVTEKIRGDIKALVQ
ncbi:MAG: 1-acyl-sn-glycerol-3-phosphate acyltransferase [Desulfobacterales bacterium]|nr:1-acyl-sn-glycerol-3-phosphate acyltransferase [Desulfobacterales bacterium]